MYLKELKTKRRRRSKVESNFPTDFLDDNDDSPRTNNNNYNNNDDKIRFVAAGGSGRVRRVERRAHVIAAVEPLSADGQHPATARRCYTVVI